MHLRGLNETACVLRFLLRPDHARLIEKKGRTMKITVPPDLERALATRAQQVGMTPELLALESLRERFATEADDTAGVNENRRTLADLLNGYVGVLHSSEQVTGGAAMSEETGKKFTAGLLKKRTAGHL